ncbi:BrxA/BrxB family bacilliredoxin [Fervidibacillus halotolerans]|uniref:BrxA/BrxB family bacilliredoxin n=1 Tax=Fervidibacillus halotolerans TaxID=2980027 RepID=A0A9E8RZL7_9BACI|nr:BrxA/BrxB family bacilliredoxin [Fervidibacillus halotolerans]WAA13274.1 BrxA/BrxB family bacilliredoxin [Fervidibacillus halotolerans]
MSMAYEEYMKQFVIPMREEMKEIGFTEFTTPEEVTEFMEGAKGTVFVVVNSVCGCAGGLARPAVKYALSKTEKHPDHLVTVFAGQDREATAKMREYFTGYEPSSPSIALLKDEQVVHFIPRDHIEGHTVEDVAQNILAALQQHC